jgi:anti-sigma B factor antagonist
VAATRREHVGEGFPGSLTITVAEQGTTTTISLQGEWDLAQQRAMRTAISDVLERSPECVVLDLSCLEFIDSTGLQGVIELHQRSVQQQARLVIVPGSGQVQRAFELVGLSERLPFLFDERGLGAARSRSAGSAGAAGSGGSLSPPPATPAARSSRGRRR